MPGINNKLPNLPKPNLTRQVSEKEWTRPSGNPENDSPQKIEDFVVTIQPTKPQKSNAIKQLSQIKGLLKHKAVNSDTKGLDKQRAFMEGFLKGTPVGSNPMPPEYSLGDLSKGIQKAGDKKELGTKLNHLYQSEIKKAYGKLLEEEFSNIICRFTDDKFSDEDDLLKQSFKAYERINGKTPGLDLDGYKEKVKEAYINNQSKLMAEAYTKGMFTKETLIHLQNRFPDEKIAPALTKLREEGLTGCEEKGKEREGAVKTAVKLFAEEHPIRNSGPISGSILEQFTKAVKNRKYPDFVDSDIQLRRDQFRMKLKIRPNKK